MKPKILTVALLLSCIAFNAVASAQEFFSTNDTESRVVAIEKPTASHPVKALTRTSNYKPGVKYAGHWTFVEPTIWLELTKRHWVKEEDLPATEEEAMDMHDKLHVSMLMDGTNIASETSRSTPQPSSQPVRIQSSNCPGGVCPTSTRGSYIPRGFRIFRR